MVSFAVQKLLRFIRSHLFIFPFVSFALGDRSKKNIAVIHVKECSALCSFSRTFMVSGLTSILSLFLYMVWGNVLIFFYM